MFIMFKYKIYGAFYNKIEIYNTFLLRLEIILLYIFTNFLGGESTQSYFYHYQCNIVNVI